ncbi:hypothetical protein MJO29_006022 [Puccinia striiformis f. sp. tritici]|nr:hypothetical protein MJO29_006022 [Puccinia striiformis f. sp. tritici]
MRLKSAQRSCHAAFWQRSGSAPKNRCADRCQPLPTAFVSASVAPLPLPSASILPRLSALGADANVVGFYCLTVNGQHCATPGFMETLISMQIGSPPITNPKTSNPRRLGPNSGGNSSSKLVDFLPSYTPLGAASSTCVDSPLSLSKSLDTTVASIDTHNTALSTLSFQIRQLACDWARLDTVISKRKLDNKTRAQQGLPLPPLAEEAALKEPSRLESMCAVSGVDSAAKKSTEISGLGVVRAYGAKAGVAN